MKFEEEKLESNLVYKGKVLEVYEDKVRLSNGKHSSREIVRHGGSVCIVAITDEKEIFLVEQYRYACKESILELPAGKLDEGEDALEAGKRELREETGVIGRDYIDLGWIYSSPGYSSEKIYFFICRVDEIKDMSPDEDEFLMVKRVSLKEAEDMVMNNEIRDSKTQLGILKASEYFRRLEKV